MAFNNLPPNAYQQTLNPGGQHPYSNDPQQMLSPPPKPGEAYTQNFLPSVLRDPFMQGMNAATQASNWAAQAIPGAAQFHQQLYNPGMNGFEQSALNSSAQMARMALGDTQAQLMGMFENAPGNSGLAPALLQAANQTAAQLGQQISQMGLQRQQLATQSMPFSFGFPIQASQASQQAAQGLFGAAQQGMYGDLQFPLAMLGSTPFVNPTVISQPAPSGGGKGKG